MTIIARYLTLEQKKILREAIKILAVEKYEEICVKAGICPECGTKLEIYASEDDRYHTCSSADCPWEKVERSYYL